MKRNFLFILIILTIALNLYGEDSEISLPDLTTVITREDTELDNIPSPDFSEVIELPLETGKLVPELPELEIIEGRDVVSVNSAEEGKQIYAEGMIGGGYPAIFIGEFSVAKIFGENPFSISFNHNSSAGFAGTELSDGYNSRNTLIILDKHFSFKNMTLDLSGQYDEIGNGLQNKVESISAMNQDSLNGAINFLWILPRGFSFGSQFDSSFYYRFSDVAYNTSDSFECPDWIKKTATISLKPTINAKWEGYGFNAGFKAAYSFVDFKNRGEFGLDFGWKNDLINAYYNVSFVIGDNLNENKFLVPFTVGIQSAIPVYFADKKLGIGIEGGLKSYQNSVEMLEKNYKFSGLNEAPSESSDWYGKFNLQLPLKNAFSTNLIVDFASTAFENGIWQPVYSSDYLTYGLYNYEMQKRTALSTNLNLTFRYKLFAITAGWKGNWLELSPLDNKHKFSVDMTLQSKEGKWGTSLSTAYSIDAADKIPEVNFEAYSQISSSVKFILSADDIVKLVTGTTRQYAGDYVSNSGSVTLLVKFLF